MNATLKQSDSYCTSIKDSATKITVYTEYELPRLW